MWQTTVNTVGCHITAHQTRANPCNFVRSLPGAPARPKEPHVHGIARTCWKPATSWHNKPVQFRAKPPRCPRPPMGAHGIARVCTKPATSRHNKPVQTRAISCEASPHTWARTELHGFARNRLAPNQTEQSLRVLCRCVSCRRVHLFGDACCTWVVPFLLFMRGVQVCFLCSVHAVHEMCRFLTLCHCHSRAGCFDVILKCLRGSLI